MLKSKHGINELDLFNFTFELNLIEQNTYKHTIQVKVQVQENIYTPY